MRIVLILLVVSQLAYADTVYRYQVTRVIDGDTVEFIIPDVPKELGKFKLRIYGIDSGEVGSRAKCSAENEKGKAATKYAKELLASAADVGMTIKGWDKYGGRVIGDLIINGHSYRDIMIEKNLVKPYDGGKKHSWCQKNVNEPQL